MFRGTGLFKGSGQKRSGANFQVSGHAQRKSDPPHEMKGANSYNPRPKFLNQSTYTEDHFDRTIGNQPNFQNTSGNQSLYLPSKVIGNGLYQSVQIDNEELNEEIEDVQHESA